MKGFKGNLVANVVIFDSARGVNKNSNSGCKPGTHVYGDINSRYSGGRPNYINYSNLETK